MSIQVNYGLHYKDVRESHQNYVRMVTTFLQAIDLKIDAFGHTLFYRETSAQHFSTPTGEYPFHQKNNKTLQCEPHNISDADYSGFNWKNAAVTSVLRDTKFKHNVVVVPFFNATSPLHDLHSNDGMTGDCTHFCAASMSLIWAPVWSFLLEAVERSPFIPAAKNESDVDAPGRLVHNSTIMAEGPPFNHSTL